MKQGLREGSCEDTVPIEEVSEEARFQRTWWDGPDTEAWPASEVCSRVWAF